MLKEVERSYVGAESMIRALEAAERDIVAEKNKASALEGEAMQIVTGLSQVSAGTATVIGKLVNDLAGHANRAAQSYIALLHAPVV